MSFWPIFSMARSETGLSPCGCYPRRRGEAAKIIPALTAALGDRGAEVRVSAAFGLGSFGSEASQATAKLQALTKDRDARVRTAAASALERIQSPGS